MHVFDLCGINNIEESIETKFLKSYKRKKN